MIKKAGIDHRRAGGLIYQYDHFGFALQTTGAGGKVIKMGKDIIMDANIYNTKEYKRSRKAYIIQCTSEYFITLLIADAFLANLLSNMGISDVLTGIISSFISFAFLFQLLSIFLVTKIQNTKRVVIVLNCLSQLLFMTMYLIPFAPFSKSVKTVFVICAVLFAYIVNYTVSGVLYKWANSFVEPIKRAEYSAGKEMVSLLLGIVFTFTIGYIIDQYNDIGNVEGGFLFIAVAMLILNICNFFSLMMIKKDSVAMEKEKMEVVPSFLEVIKNTLGNKNFISVVIMTVMWNAARYMTVGFLGTFKTKDLAISVGTVQVINIVGQLARFFISKPFGRFSDKRSFATGIRWAFVIEALSYFMCIFAAPKTWWFIAVYTVLYNISMAGSNQNSFNIVYSYVEGKYIVQAMAIKNSIGGICGFLISLLGGKILSLIQKNGNSFLGLHIYGQQLLAAISFVILVGTALYVHFVIEKQKTKIQ